MMTPTLTTLYEHLRWADARAREAIRSLEAGSEEHREAVVTYAHIAASEEVWLARIEGRKPEHPVWPALELEEAGALAARTGAALEEVARSVDEHARTRDGTARPGEMGTLDRHGSPGDREVVYTNSSGNEYRNRLEDVLLHVALHGAYHRGQLAYFVRRGGGTPNPTDYIVFLRGDPAPVQVRPT